ncbi:uncharacterized protein LOC116765917 [Danaus plexippus]|uniref:uncharacterized protein LOC116765917 n=1 Tax=Danaus plexippus TaxID=13037 RepID=UPI002AB15654|nr:uncharacterized protein LOC116765917 [Danaus plexippus]
MESSGESFTWTDASSDSCDMIPGDNNTDHGSDKGSKRDKGRETCEIQHKEKETKKKKRRASQMLETSPINTDKSIKAELESDLEAPKKKKKRKNTESQDCLEPSQDSLLAEDYLNLRVKQEQLSFVEPEPVKKKKKSKKEKLAKSETQDSESTDTSSIRCEVNNTYDDNSLNNFDETIIEIDKFEAEETVVQSKKKKSEDFTSNTSENDRMSLEISTEKLLSNNQSGKESHSVTNGYLECESDFEPKIKLKPAPQIKSAKTKKKSLEKELSAKTTRISDKITYDDEGSADAVNAVTGPSKQLQQFLNMNPNLKPYTPDMREEDIITGDDEIWVLRVPKEIDIKAFRDLNITLAAKLKVKINGHSYDGSIENHLSQVPLLCHGRKNSYIKNMPCMGEISLRKRIPKAHIPQESCMVNNQTNFIPLPETKCRHPLFGLNYKKAIKIPSAIAERLNGSVDNHASELFNGKKEKKRKQKKEKRKTEKESDTEVNTTEYNASEAQELSSKNKRKRKNSEDVTKTKKSKRAKLDLDSAEAWESERAIEENLFNF